jgi:hypothetical protein
MDKLENLYERIRGFNRVEVKKAFEELSRNVQLLDLHLKTDGIAGSGEVEEMEVSMSITNCFYWLMVVAAGRNINSDIIGIYLDRKLRMEVARDQGPGPQIAVMQPTVINQDNTGPTGILSAPIDITEEKKKEIEDTWKDTVVKNIFEKAAGKYRYEITTRVYKPAGMDWISSFNLTLPPESYIINAFYDLLCYDLKKATGFNWIYSRHEDNMEMSTDHQIPEIFLETPCNIVGPTIRRL